MKTKQTKKDQRKQERIAYGEFLYTVQRALTKAGIRADMVYPSKYPLSSPPIGLTNFRSAVKS